jgi:hypothetical protein
MLPQTYINIYDRFTDDARGSQEHHNLLDIQEGNHPEITSEILRRIIAPTMKSDSDANIYINKKELGDIVQALRDMIPALNEANTIVVEQRNP